MHWIDLLILLPPAWGLYKGIKRGFIIEAVSLFAILAGIWLAIRLSDATAHWLADLSGSGSMFLPAIAFLLILFCVLLAGYLSGKILTAIAKTIALGLVNRVAGGLFGTAKMILILSLILFMINVADTKLQFIPAGFREKSLLFDPVSEFAARSVPALKSSVIFDNYIQDQD